MISEFLILTVIYNSEAIRCYSCGNSAETTNHRKNVIIAKKCIKPIENDYSVECPAFSVGCLLEIQGMY